MIKWLTISQIARETAQSVHEARKDLNKIAFVFPRNVISGRAYWDARAVDLLRKMRSQPHRTLEPAHSDWLATYLKEQADASPTT